MTEEKVDLLVSTLVDDYVEGQDDSDGLDAFDELAKPFTQRPLHAPGQESELRSFEISLVKPR